MSNLNTDALEREVYQTAFKHVSNMLQRPDQLDKIEQYKKRVKRNINSKESMLKTAMQTQLDGVKTGLIHLKAAANDISEIKNTIRLIEETFPSIPMLYEKLKYVREESMKHSQYAVSMENLKHIFNVPETVAKTRELIMENYLLEAHLNLYELEKSRDNLLFQLHRLAPTNNADKNMLKHYYAEVEKLSEELGKQLWLIIRLTLNTVRKEPSLIVTALRIIEREELLDEAAMKRAESTGFMSQGRPKNWKKRVFEILEEAVNERIAGNKFHERYENKMWLVMHLEMTRKIILDDLKVVKYACVSCFPPSYDIVRRMFHLYHRCLSAYLQELVSTLEGNEYITLLNWLNAYEGTELLGHPDLRFSLKDDCLPPLLTDEIIEDLMTKYLLTVEKNYKEWLANTIRHESKDWHTNHHPEADNSGHYQTTTPVIVFQMIDQHLQVASIVSMDLVNRVLLLSMKHLTEFAKQYQEAVNKYAKSHFDNRTQNFTPNMIAISNNCSSLMDNALKFQKEYRKDDLNQLKMDNAFSNMIKSFEKLKEESIGYLIKEILLDVDCEINKVGSIEWLEGTVSVVDNVRLTLEDYLRDYVYLKDANSDALKVQLQKSLAKSYIASILSKRTPLRSQSKREDFARKCIEEARTIDETIEKLPTKIESNSGVENPFKVVPMLMDFLKLNDLSMLYLEIMSFMKHYPDIKADHFVALLSLREDIKTGVRKKVAESMPPDTDIDKNIRTIFSEIIIN
ncbi:exocyst complex component Sec6 isoform X2 [Dermatophagoides farinae]|uniref:Exocyst complex component 3-like protein n=2 Tax=Dermatophagoides farinae TaxID=6954 RepID=A0A9D4SBZ2_DERFA|nr:exocyst complex component 3-like isoform X2 [Dermatophagoides farinae]KAH7636787.1 exocyst complex component 3-like protein [Dermatophagoides farinae]